VTLVLVRVVPLLDDLHEPGFDDALIGRDEPEAVNASGRGDGAIRWIAQTSERRYIQSDFVCSGRIRNSGLEFRS
jgi:hypothetical protein